MVEFDGYSRSTQIGWKSNRDKWYFFGAFLVGVGAILALDVMGIGKIWPVLICVAIMILYAISTWNVAGLQLRADQAGDNIYYLGLLFTLSSLGLVLFRFSTSVSGTDAIVRNFGIAISTTIVGLALRVLLAQMRVDPEDIERESKIHLAEASRELAQEMGLSVEQFRHTRIASSQVMAESASGTADVLKTTVDELLKQFGESVNEVSESVRESNREFAEQAKSINKTSKAVVRGLDKLVDKMENIRADEDLIANGLRPVFAKLESETVQFSSQVRDQWEQIAGSLSQLEKSTTAMGAMESSTTEFAEAVSRASVSAKEFSVATDKIGSMEAQIGVLSDSILHHLELVGKQSAHTFEVTKGQVTQLETLTESVTESLTKISSSQIDSLLAIEAAHQGKSDELSVETGKFIIALKSSSSLVEQVRNELASLSEYLIKRLEV